MATFSAGVLTGATNGYGIVMGSGTAGTIHECGTGLDEVWLWAYNGGTADIALHLHWGTSAMPRIVTIPYQAGLVPITPGVRVPSGFKIMGTAGSSGVIVIDGNVNNIAP